MYISLDPHTNIECSRPTYSYFVYFIKIKKPKTYVIITGLPDDEECVDIPVHTQQFAISLADKRWPPKHIIYNMEL